MNPDVVVTDEIYGAEEVDAVLDAMRAGVKVAASLHATGVSDLKTPFTKNCNGRWILPSY